MTSSSFIRKGYAASVSGKAADGCPIAAAPLVENWGNGRSRGPPLQKLRKIQRRGRPVCRPAVPHKASGNCRGRRPRRSAGTSRRAEQARQRMAEERQIGLPPRRTNHSPSRGCALKASANLGPRPRRHPQFSAMVLIAPHPPTSHSRVKLGQYERFSFPPCTAHFLLEGQKKMGGQKLPAPL